MSIAPLLMLLNANSDQERSAVATALTMSMLPGLNKNAAMAIAGFSALNTVRNEQVQQGAIFRSGFTAALDCINPSLHEDDGIKLSNTDISDTEKKRCKDTLELFHNQRRLLERAESALAREKVENKEKDNAINRLTENNKALELRLSHIKEELDTLKANPSVEQNVLTEAVAQEMEQLHTIMRLKPKRAPITRKELASLPLLHEHLEKQQKIELFTAANKDEG